jgi:HD-GYP domain-containing protein (c-di-GMP phosphodiesterase class II)
MKVKIDTKDLMIGMYVAELDRPWLETPFLFQGFAIASQGDLNELQRCCEFVFIDEARSNYKKEEVLSSSSRQTVEGTRAKNKFERPPHKITVEEEISEARNIREVAEKQVSDLMQQARGGRALSVLQANAVVGNIVDSLSRSPDAMVLLASMKSHEKESEAHAINASILCITLGRFMKLSNDRVKELGLAALLHDVGEVKIPLELLKRANKSAQEAELVRRHTEYGAEILRSSAGVPESAAEVAFSHHEQVDGKGYPRGLRGDEISLFAKIVAIVDLYDSLTKGYEARSMSPTEAMRYLYLYRDKLFDGMLIEAFIKCLGIYPIGSLIELETGDVGIVISVQPGELLHPKLLLIMGHDKKIFAKPKIMNLALFAKNEPDKYGVKQVLNPDAYGIDLRSYLLNESML